MHGMLQGGLGTQVQVKAFRNTPENNNENNDRNWGRFMHTEPPIERLRNCRIGATMYIPQLPSK